MREQAINAFRFPPTPASWWLENELREWDFSPPSTSTLGFGAHRVDARKMNRIKGGKRFFITFRILRLKLVVMRKAERYVKQEIILFIEKISFLILQKTVRQ